MSGRAGGRISRRGFILAGGATVGALSVAAALPARSEGKIYPGVTIAGVNVSGLSQDEARDLLQQHVASFLKNPITYVYQGKSWTCTADDLGISIDFDSALDKAWSHGRGDGITGRYSALLSQSDSAISLTAHVNPELIDEKLQTISTALNTDAVDAKFGMNGTQITITPEVSGRTLNVDDARQQTLNALSSLQPSTVMLRVTIIPADVTAADLEPAKTQAALLVSHKVTIRHGDSRWTLERADLARAVVVPKDALNDKPFLDPGTVKLMVADIANQLSTPATDAVLAWGDDGLYAQTDSTPGVEVDVDKLVQDVIAAAAKPTDRNVPVPVTEVAPNIDSKHLDKLGITTLMGEGDSSFDGSSEARATNVHVAAQKINYSVIPPGGNFDFLAAVGTISVDAGFVEGKIISGGWYANDVGGGVCQVSTTVYRAALRAGLPFPEWHPHSEEVSFYELDGWPAGIDATVFQPEDGDTDNQLDLLINNPTDSWILIQLSSDGMTLYCDFYGPDTGWTVDISDPVISDRTKPGPKQTTDTPDLPKGQTQQIQQPQDGFTTTMTRTVTDKDGNVIENDTFVSVYAPVAEGWEVGTGPADAGDDSD